MRMCCHRYLYRLSLSGLSSQRCGWGFVLGVRPTLFWHAWNPIYQWIYSSHSMHTRFRLSSHDLSSFNAILCYSVAFTTLPMNALLRDKRIELSFEVILIAKKSVHAHNIKPHTNSFPAHFVGRFDGRVSCCWQNWTVPLFAGKLLPLHRCKLHGHRRCCTKDFGTAILNLHYFFSSHHNWLYFHALPLP